MYNHVNLPPVIPNSGGHMKPGLRMAACRSPIDTIWPFPESWGVRKDYMMSVPRGGWVICFRRGYSYYDNEFDVTCVLTGKVLDPNQDNCAAEIFDRWVHEYNFSMLILEAERTVGAIVVGEVSPEAVGKRFSTTRGEFTLQEGDRIVHSRRFPENIYRVQRGYSPYGDDVVYPGDLPAEYS